MYKTISWLTWSTRPVRHSQQTNQCSRLKPTTCCAAGAAPSTKAAPRRPQVQLVGCKILHAWTAPLDPDIYMLDAKTRGHSSAVWNLGSP